MSRKHFKALADALRESHPGLTGFDTPEARRTWRDACRNVAAACYTANPNFDGERFFDACTPAGRVWGA